MTFASHNAASDREGNLSHCRDPEVSVTVGNKVLKHECSNGTCPSRQLFKVLWFPSVETRKNTKTDSQLSDVMMFFT